MMSLSRQVTKWRLRSLLWLPPVLSLALAMWACGGTVRPPPVTHLPASQLRMMIQIFGQYNDTPIVQTLIQVNEAQSGQTVSLADKTRLTCNGSDVKYSYPNNVKRTCPRQPPGGAYRFTYTDEDGASTTVVVPVPTGQFAILSPVTGATVPIPGDGALAVRFAIPTPPPNSSISYLNVRATCQAPPGATGATVENGFVAAATPTPLTGVASPTTLVNPGPPTPTPSSGSPTATVFENRGPPTPTSPPGSTPTAPTFDGTVTHTGGLATVALNGDYSQFQPGSGYIDLSITMRVAPDRGDFASASALIGGDVSTNVTWSR